MVLMVSIVAQRLSSSKTRIKTLIKLIILSISVSQRLSSSKTRIKT